MKKPVTLLLLFVLLCSPLFCQEQSPSSQDKIEGWLQELENIENERNQLIESIKNSNDLEKKEIEERRKDLDRREAELNRSIENSKRSDLLAQEAVNYSKTLERKLVFYKGATITLGATTIVGAIALLAVTR